jgi:hypothetical protein
MKNKKADINDVLKRISKLEARLDDIAPIAKRKLPSKKDQIEQIKSEIDVWSEKFPSVDIEFELAKMLDWLKATNKRKKDYRAFFRNWLRKSTNSIGNDPSPIQSYVYGCNNKRTDCKDEISSFKDMSFYCDECNDIKTIIKTIKS